MSTKPNPTVIGLFMVTGLALGVTGIFLFSSFEFFAKKREVIIYIDDSLNGLDEGAPVKYRGVKIGSVKRVMVRYNQADADFAMPVILDIDERLVRERLGEQVEIFTEHSLEERVKAGFRASLQSESLVTGVLYIEMRLSPTAPPPVYHQLIKYYIEIPTERTEIQKLFSELASLDIKSIETNVNNLILRIDKAVEDLDVADLHKSASSALKAIDRIVSSPDVDSNLSKLNATLEEFRSVGVKLNQRFDPLADSVTKALRDANQTLDGAAREVTNALNDANRTLDKVATQITTTLSETDRALTQVRGAAEHLKSSLAPDSSLRIDLDLALRQIADASQAIATLVDFLKLYPNAMLVGREAPPKKP